MSKHSDLVERAARWLRNSATYNNDYGGREYVQRTKCSVVLTELVCTISEVPDAIGWINGGLSSIMIECKTSRSDFLADKKKVFRLHPHMGVGNFRYYLCEPGIIKVDSLPEKWGLLNVHGRQVRIERVAKPFQEYNFRSEKRMLFSYARRCQANKK